VDWLGDIEKSRLDSEARRRKISEPLQNTAARVGPTVVRLLGEVGNAYFGSAPNGTPNYWVDSGNGTFHLHEGKDGKDGGVLANNWVLSDRKRGWRISLYLNPDKVFSFSVECATTRWNYRSSNTSSQGITEEALKVALKQAVENGPIYHLSD
jgi:hypothetical protein